MKENKINWWLIIGIIVVVAVITALVTLQVTGNAIKLNQDARGRYQAYTTSEIDAKFSALKGTCQYIHYKDAIYRNLDNLTIENICQNKLGGFVPKIIVETESRDLYNKQNCSSSYQIYSKTADNLISYKTELAGVKLGQPTLNACYNAVFPDGSSNAEFSTQTYRRYSGVLCCKN